MTRTPWPKPRSEPTRCRSCARSSSARGRPSMSSSATKARPRRASRSSSAASGRRIRAPTAGCGPRSWSRTSSRPHVARGGTQHPSGRCSSASVPIARMIVAHRAGRAIPERECPADELALVSATPPRWVAELAAAARRVRSRRRRSRTRDCARRGVRCARARRLARGRTGRRRRHRARRAAVARPSRDRGRAADHGRAARADPALTRGAAGRPRAPAPPSCAGAPRLRRAQRVHDTGQGAWARSGPSSPMPAARRNLRVTLTYLQSVLEPDRPRDEPPFYLSVDQERIRLAGAPHVVLDIRQFEAVVASAEAATSTGDLDAGHRRVRARAPAVARRLPRGVPRLRVGRRRE